MYAGFRQATSKTQAACSFSNKPETTMQAKEHLLSLSNCIVSCLLFKMLIIISFISPVAAQDTDTKNKEENTITGSVGTYFSLIGALYEPIPDREIQEPEDDVIPVPGIFLSIKYTKKFQGLIGWANDNKNEDILKLSLRYNRYANNHMYIFGGPVLWHFNKSYNFTKIECTEYSSDSHPLSPACVPGAEREVEIKTDRPDGASITFGIISGLGIEYKLGFFAFSHEFELFFSPCQYRDFVCFGGDFKFLGVHFEF